MRCMKALSCPLRYQQHPPPSHRAVCIPNPGSLYHRTPTHRCARRGAAVSTACGVDTGEQSQPCGGWREEGAPVETPSCYTRQGRARLTGGTCRVRLRCVHVQLPWIVGCLTAGSSRAMTCGLVRPSGAVRMRKVLMRMGSSLTRSYRSRNDSCGSDITARAA
jgi:hypothetical protein